MRQQKDIHEKEKQKKKDGSESYPGFLRILFGHLSQYRLSVFFAVLGAVITGVCVAAMPHFIKFIVDDCIEVALAGGDGAELLRMAGIACIVYVAVALTRQLSWRFGLYFMMKALEGVIFNLRSKFFGHVQHMCMRFSDKQSSGELFNCIMGSPMANIRTFLNQIIMSLPYQLVAFIISLVALFSYDWLLTLILLLTAGVMVVFNRLAKKKIRRMTKEYLDSEAAASKYISDMLHGMDAIKTYAIEDSTMSTFDARLVDMRDKGVRQTFTISYENMKPELVRFIGTALVYFAGAYSCIFRGMSVGTLYAFLSCMGILLDTLNSWLALFLQYSSADVAMRKIDAVMKEHTSTPELEEGKTHSIEIERESAKRSGKPCICFDGVSFAYDQKPIFDRLSCEIRSGESIALVGGSGSGKSTLTKLILRLYEVGEGHVRLYGRDVRDYSLKDLRRSFGVVPQNPFIFYGTIWDNIRIARPDASNYDIINAMEIAHVHEFVNELPMGWSTVIGDGALGLSGGQKQRIAIARAILKSPDILIFDEATSALDNLSERHIQAAMEELMKTHTVIIVAHRLSTVRNAKAIMVLEQGQIIERGDHDDLLAQKGRYYQLYTGQAELE